MSNYLTHKPGSLEEVVAKATQLESGYQDKFKKELEKTGKGIGAMTPKEKSAFFSKIDKEYKAKNEEITEETLVEFTSQQIKMAYGIANDKRYKGGNYSGAIAAIEKIAKGLSSHPAVQNVLKRTNENLDEGKMSQIDQMQKDGKSAAEIAKL